MFRRLKQNVMVKLDMAKQTEFPHDVNKAITFCENSKSDVTAIEKATEQMVSNFKAIGMTHSDTIADACNCLAVKTSEKKFARVMKDTEEAVNEIAKIERKTAERVESKFLESWAKVWLKKDLKNYLDDINDLKKKRLDKDGLAQSANKHPEDQSKLERSKDADARYNEQLMKVESHIKEFQAHYQKTAEATRELITVMAEHFDKCIDMTQKKLKHAKEA